METIKINVKEAEYKSHEKAKELFDVNTVYIGIENEFTVSRKKYPFCRKRANIHLKPSSCQKQIYCCNDCPEYIEREADLALVQHSLMYKMQPTKMHYCYGDDGVFNVGVDGSVPNGIEIMTTGLPLVPEIIYNTSQKMFEKIAFTNPQLNQYCGLHTHVIQYGDGDTMSFFPYGPYTLHNIMALNIYALPLLALMGTINCETRYNVFRLPYQYINCLNNKNLLNHVDKQPHSGKYIAVTPYLSQTRNGKLKHIHLEFRYPDNYFDPTYYLIHSVFPAIFSIIAAQLPADEIFDTNTQEYKESLKLIVKIINDGEGDRKGLYLVKNEDIKRILKIRDSLSKLVGPMLEKIDPYGNLIKVWENFPEILPYKSTQPIFNLINGLS